MRTALSTTRAPFTASPSATECAAVAALPAAALLAPDSIAPAIAPAPAAAPAAAHAAAFAAARAAAAAYIAVLQPPGRPVWLPPAHRQHQRRLVLCTAAVPRRRRGERRGAYALLS